MSGIIINILIGVLGVGAVALLVRSKIREVRSGGCGCSRNCSRCSGCRGQSKYQRKGGV